ncbi:MAG: hypothetical protein IT385_12685 [Deltaproteobacteria bacterium]|nr:hypothetical protein [Deltaproteobacteria bacterium]
MTEPIRRYEVRTREHHGGGLFELEITTWYEVVDVVTDRVVMRFEGGYSASYDGVGWGDGAAGGVAAVVISEDGRAVEVRLAGGRIERHALPPDPAPTREA